jgi:hypothetical protein
MKHLVLITLALTVPFLTGCPKSQPKVPAVISSRLASYELDRFDKDAGLYDAAVGGRQFDEAQRLRDRIVDRLKGNIDANYHEFENQLFTGRARDNFLLDVVDLGAGVATTISNGERAKTIIAAALTGFKGGRKSYDENWFRERTVAVIISQMQASRAHVETEMLKNMQENVNIYSLDAALGDLINYFYAGTLQKGLQELAQQTGQSAIKEKKAVQDEREKLRPGTPERRKTSILIRDRFNDLFKDALVQPINLEKQAEAVKIAKQAVQELSGKPVDPNITNTDLFTALDSEIEKASVSENGIDRVRKALRIE